MKKSTCFVFAVALLFTCSSAFSQPFVMVMKAMDGTTKLNGGSIVPGHTGEIDIWSYSQGENLCPGCAKPAISDYNLMTSFNASTISFKKLLLNAKILTSVDVTYIKQGTTPFTFFRIHMENVLVSSEQESGSQGGDSAPTVSISLTADRIAWQQIAQKSDGTTGPKTSYGWDAANNVEWLFAF